MLIAVADVLSIKPSGPSHSHGRAEVQVPISKGDVQKCAPPPVRHATGVVGGGRPRLPSNPCVFRTHVAVEVLKKKKVLLVDSGAACGGTEETRSRGGAT